jgi:hypothetical protein
MGNQLSIKRVNFEDVQTIIKEKNKYILINTITDNLQKCLIYSTINVCDEETIINNLINTNKNINIIIYGKNANDLSVYDKYDQLIKLGFNNLYIYPGGIFEWLCLQDIYSSDYFPTNKTELDILKYKPPAILNAMYITNGID